MSAVGVVAFVIVSMIPATFFLAWMEGMSPREFIRGLRNRL